jgi:hypothetical protein
MIQYSNKVTPYTESGRRGGDYWMPRLRGA